MTQTPKTQSEESGTLNHTEPQNEDDPTTIPQERKPTPTPNPKPKLQRETETETWVVQETPSESGTHSWATVSAVP